MHNQSVGPNAANGQLPLGRALALLSKPFEVCIDRPMLDLTHVHISGGQRGLDVKIGVQDLIKLTKAKTVMAT